MQLNATEVTYYCSLNMSEGTHFPRRTRQIEMGNAKLFRVMLVVSYFSLFYKIAFQKLMQSSFFQIKSKKSKAHFSFSPHKKEDIGLNHKISEMKNPLHQKIYRFEGIRTFSWQCTQICWSSLTAWIHFLLSMPVSWMMANSGETGCLVYRLYHSAIPRRFQQIIKCSTAEGIF